MEKEYMVKVPKIYRSSKWNGMVVRIIDVEEKYVITVNKKGKRLRFYKKWLIAIT